MRACKKCSETKPLDDFQWYTTKKGNRLQRYTCKACVASRVQEYRAATGPRPIYSNLKWKYNITREQYEEMIKGGCDVCGSTQMLSIDHDHNCCEGKRSCGECVRGALCNDCNWAEGLLKGDVERIMSLAAYLLEWEKKGVDSRPNR